MRNSFFVFVFVAALVLSVVVIGVIIFFAVSSGGEKQEQTAMVPPVTATDGCGETDVDVNTGNDGGDEEDLDLSGGTTEPAKAIGDPAEDATDGDARPSADTTPAKKLGGSRKKRASDGRKSRWDPPADLEHLEGTSPEDRKRIDDLITTMIDVFAGKDSLDAKQTLIALGKPAFPRILGAMAKIRDTITDVDSDDERLIESGLKLADECLREMDGWLTAKGKSSLRPGSEKRYIGYICRLHYKRWMQQLKVMPEMPGPYDPAGEYEGEVVKYRIEAGK